MKSMIIFFCFIASMQGCKENIGQPKKNLKQITEPLTLGPPGWPWRGITIVSHTVRKEVTEKAIKDLAHKGVNLIRLRLSIRKFAEKNKISPEESMESTFLWAEQIVLWSTENNIKVLISVPDFPFDPQKSYKQTSSKFWDSENDLSQSLENIKTVVQRFNSFENVVAYEFIAEPVIKGSFKPRRPLNWNIFFTRIIKTVRETSDKYILYTPGPGGSPNGYASMGEKFQDNRVIYNFHFYRPHKYTHQGVGKYREEYIYPGRIGLTYWNKDKLRDEVNVALKWAKENKVNYIFAGEFSVVRNAEGRNRYLADLLSVFEEKNISWAYFCFNGWKGWSYPFEHFDLGKKEKSDIRFNAKKNETEMLLEEFWKKNQIPSE